MPFTRNNTLETGAAYVKLSINVTAFLVVLDGEPCSRTHLPNTPLSQGIDIMTEPKPSATRRQFLETTGLAATASALAGVAVPAVHAAENNTIQVALIGCGGRGTGAVGDALSTTQGPIKLVAMADVFDDRLRASYQHLVKEHGNKIDVKNENKFIGFDGYQKAMDCLKPGDVVILATPPAFRWVQFTLRDRKGAEHVHGKADQRRRADDPQDAGLGRGGQEEESQGRRRSDVPSLRGSRGTLQPHQGRPDRRSRLAAGIPPDRPGRLGTHRTQARRHQRIALSDQEVSRFPLGQRRLLQRLLDPQY